MQKDAAAIYMRFTCEPVRCGRSSLPHRLGVAGGAASREEPRRRWPTGWHGTCTDHAERGQGRPAPRAIRERVGAFTKDLHGARTQAASLWRSMQTAKPRILVVEDEAAIRDGLTDVL